MDIKIHHSRNKANIAYMFFIFIISVFSFGGNLCAASLLEVEKTEIVKLNQNKDDVKFVSFQSLETEQLLNLIFHKPQWTSIAGYPLIIHVQDNVFRATREDIVASSMDMRASLNRAP